MIFISKLISVFLLPPGFFIAVLLFLVFFVPRKFKCIIGITALLLYALSIQPVSDFLLKPLENAYPPLDMRRVDSTPLLAQTSDSEQLPENADESQKENPLQAIVILGGGVIQGSPEAGIGRETLAADAEKRAVYAFTLKDKFSVPLVFSGGKVFDYNQEAEAVTAGRFFAALGLPQERFIAEDKSRNTWENARETAKLTLNGAALERVILVTSAYHIKRSVYCFEQNGISVIPAPTNYKTDRGRKYDIFSFMPSMIWLENSHLALHEYIGLIYYIAAYR